jgi:hypothetical protein
MTGTYDQIYGGSKYFSVPDLDGGTRRATIGKVEPADLRQADGTMRKRLVLFFNGQDKALPLNQTNASTLANAFGKNPDDWVYRRIELFSEMTGLGRPGVRIRVLHNQKPVQDDMDDQIPW